MIITPLIAIERHLACYKTGVYRSCISSLLMFYVSKSSSSASNYSEAHLQLCSATATKLMLGRDFNTAHPEPHSEGLWWCFLSTPAKVNALQLHGARGEGWSSLQWAFRLSPGEPCTLRPCGRRSQRSPWESHVFRFPHVCLYRCITSFGSRGQRVAYTLAPFKKRPLHNLNPSKR